MHRRETLYDTSLDESMQGQRSRDSAVEFGRVLCFFVMIVEMTVASLGDSDDQTGASGNSKRWSLIQSCGE